MRTRLAAVALAFLVLSEPGWATNFDPGHVLVGVNGGVQHTIRPAP